MPAVAFAAGTLVQSAGGLLLILGLYIRFAAFGLIAFTVVAGIIALNFWDKRGEARSGNIASWQTNLAVIGGLLLASASS